MNRFVAVFVLGLVFALTSGCSPAPKGPAPTVAVKGFVKLDGNPMPDGEIRFSAPGETPKNFPIKDGAYSGQAVVGTNRVEVYRLKDGPPPTTEPTGPPTKINTIPPQYNSQSGFTADVTESGANEFKFDVNSK